MNLYSSKTLTDNHTHRRTHARDKHNKTAEKKKKELSINAAMSLSINLLLP